MYRKKGEKPSRYSSDIEVFFSSGALSVRNTLAKTCYNISTRYLISEHILICEFPPSRVTTHRRCTFQPSPPLEAFSAGVTLLDVSFPRLRHQL